MNSLHSWQSSQMLRRSRGGPGRGSPGRGRSQSAISKRTNAAHQNPRVVVVKSRQLPRQTEHNPKLTAADSNQCLISENTDIKSAAGYVAALLREGKPPQVLAISAGNVNRAVKMLALVRNYLEAEALDLYVQVDFPEYSTSSESTMVTLHVFQKAKRTDLSRVNAHLSVSARSVHASVAGAIAGNLREATLNRICVSAAGPMPILCTLKSIFLARHFMHEEQKDISMVPEFDHSDESGISIVNMFVLSHPIGQQL